MDYLPFATRLPACKTCPRSLDRLAVDASLLNFCGEGKFLIQIGSGPNPPVLRGSVYAEGPCHLMEGVTCVYPHWRLCRVEG